MRLIFFILLIINFAHAHPLTYKGGSEVYFEYQSFMKEHNFLHTFSPTQSLGFKHIQMDNKDFYFLQANNLLKRWNNEDSQANIFLLTSLGVNPPRSPAISIGTAADWESRKYYISSKYLMINGDELFRSRIGYAPHLASFKETQFWTMLEYNHFLSETSFNDLTPILRIISGAILVDLGFSVNSNYLLNFMLHF